ncbi:hypothetical protein QBC36DRAFT_391352 [Triangularia setosa]|uniref:Ribosomal RNA methyltransferase FtsJ domain-containing protein n=1 Tax=Triangularia setosa TaxID=2587417 RepID=A0AAN6VXI6_9PEZI|nr:hypothetical protein QBC36DRAFT_391352 [Podospora setosa]
MQRIATELQNATGGCFTTKTKSGAILDICTAPGGFLVAAMALNDPSLRIRACPLPFSQGSYKIILPHENNHAIQISYLDITMFAEDMGMGLNEISASHPDHRQFMHAPIYHEGESIRLQTSSFVLALEHLRPGGTLITLLHKIEVWGMACLLQTMSMFSEVRVHKPKSGRANRSFFYVVAKNVQSASREAEVYQAARESGPQSEELVAEFGPRLVKLGRSVCFTQANALAKAPFLRN